MNKHLLIFSFIFLIFQSFYPEKNPENYFEAGMDYINNGEFEKGINLWIKAKDDLQADGKADFRIGIKFIESVTKNQAENLYPLASEFYYWGLNSNTIDYCLDYVKKELDMLKPIVEEAAYTQWETLAENNNAEVLTRIKHFWMSKDPSMATSMNERLIEHWERITYARENFNKVNTTIYNTDDRGLIYIKYGEPDQVDEGTFTLNFGKVQQWVGETLDHQYQRMEEYAPELFTDNAISDADGFVSDEIYKQNLSKRLTDKLHSDFGHVEYTVWIYDRSLVETSQNLIYFFGKLGHTGAFGLVDGPEDLLTQRTFRQRDLGGTRFRYNFGPISQLSFYDNLKFVDDYFLDSFHELQDELFNNPEITSESSTEYLRTRYINQMNDIRAAANESLSLYDRELLRFNVLYKKVRFLDQNYNPYEVNLIYSEPHEAIISDFNQYTSQYGDSDEPEYHIQHTYSILDSDYNLISSTSDFPAVTFERFDFADDYIKPVSIFRMPPSRKNELNRHVEAKLYNISYNKQQHLVKSNRNRLPDELIGSQSIEIRSSTDTAPLNQNNLELSDIILCYGYDSVDETVIDSTADSKHEDLFFPCYVPFEMKIPTSQDLNFFFEIYNLETDNDNLASFTINYEAHALEQSPGFFSRLFGSSEKTPTSITLTYNINGDRMQDHLMVDLSDYTPGTYELTLTITDIHSGNVVSRSSRFEVLSD